MNRIIKIMIDRTEYFIFAGQGVVGKISNKDEDNETFIIVHIH